MKCPSCKATVKGFYCEECESHICWRCLGIQLHHSEVKEKRSFKVCECNPISLHYVTPQCCETVQKTGSVYIHVDIYEEYKNQKPAWMTLGHEPKHVDTELHSSVAVPAEYCPHCGTHVPEIVRSKVPQSRILKCTDTGYYCDTCKDRLRSCRCAHTSFKWMPKPKRNITIAPSTGHGKACKGNKRTSTIQVREILDEKNYLLLKQFRYTVGDQESRSKALKKAQDYVEENA